MSGTTATQGLIYPTSTDRMCDGATQLEVLAKGINARYAVLDGLVSQGELPEAVLVEWVSDTPTLDALTSTAIIWNTVQVDDADAFDAGISGVALTLPYTAPGQLWEIGMAVEGDWTAVSGGVEAIWALLMDIRNSAGVSLLSIEEERPARPVQTNVGSGSIVTFHKTTGPDVVTASWTTVNDGPRLRFGQLWAFRIGEA